MAITSIKTGSSFTNLQKYNDFLGPNAAYIPTSFESIATLTASGGETSLTFSSIPSTYASLQIRGIGRLSAESTTYIRLNSDSGTNYARHWLRGNGATASATGLASDNYGWGFRFSTSSDAASIFGAGIIDIHDYASTTKNKTIRGFTGYDANGSGDSILLSSVWLSTSAVTSVTILPFSATFAAGSTFALYGIKGA